MLRPTYDEMDFIALLLEGFLCGLYSGVFAMYLQYQTLKRDTNNRTRTVVFYSICALYVLSIAVFVCDIAVPIYKIFGGPADSRFPIYFIQTTSFACCGFITQFILIYRCWIVWGRNICIVIIPSILAFAFLGTWLAGGTSMHLISYSSLPSHNWVYLMPLCALTLSLIVNSRVTGLIVFRIFKVFREVKAVSDNQILGATGGSKLRPIIFILIESGIALFAIQSARLVVSIVKTDSAIRAYSIVVAIHNMLNGIIPTISLVRTSMGLSFHDEKSMEEVAIGTLRFASNLPNSVPETGSNGIVSQDNRDDGIGIRRSNDIEVVERST